ncbi:MAG TPA: hypothetical protein VF744_11560 [Beijerinckiaceae bacterium]|jgi:hypothetical protein
MSLRRLGGEYAQNYAFGVGDYLIWCMGFPAGLITKVERMLGPPVRRIDEVLRDLPPLNAAEWLLFCKDG